MSRPLLAILRRDIALLLLGGRRGGATLPLLFFLSVAMLFPFAVGPDPVVLARTGGGVIWVAALLAARGFTNVRVVPLLFGLMTLHLAERSR